MKCKGKENKLDQRNFLLGSSFITRRQQTNRWLLPAIEVFIRLVAFNVKDFLDDAKHSILVHHHEHIFWFKSEVDGE